MALEIEVFIEPLDLHLRRVATLKRVRHKKDLKNDLASRHEKGGEHPNKRDLLGFWKDREGSQRPNEDGMERKVVAPSPWCTPRMVLKGINANAIGPRRHHVLGNLWHKKYSNSLPILDVRLPRLNYGRIILCC